MPTESHEGKAKLKYLPRGTVSNSDVPQGIPEFVCCFCPSVYQHWISLSQHNLVSTNFCLAARSSPVLVAKSIFKPFPNRIELSGKQSNRVSEIQTPPPASGHKHWLLSVENAAAFEAKMGITDPFIPQRRKEQSHKAKDPDFPCFWARQVENRTASKAKRETQIP